LERDLQQDPIDSLQADSVRGEAMAAAVDSIIVEEYEPIDLERLYASITTNFADSPFADRATSIQKTLAETRRERAEADSLARASADSLARVVAGETAPWPDSLALEDSMFVEADSLDAGAPPTTFDADSTLALPSDTDALS